MTVVMDSSVSAEEAARMLGVSRQTLYAYVSRGLVTALPGPDQRQSRYPREAVAELAERRRRGRRPKEIAKTALDWGLPVLETKLTLIERERLYFRGVDAVALSEEASLEDVACLLWQVDKDEAFGDAPPAFDPRVLDFVASRPGPAFRDDLLARFAIIAEDADTAAWQQEGARIAAGCGGLVRLLAAAMFGAAPTAEPLHRQCAIAWRLDAAAASAVRRALVLCADHELNASSFTARCSSAWAIQPTERPRANRPKAESSGRTRARRSATRAKSIEGWRPVRSCTAAAMAPARGSRSPISARIAFARTSPDG